MNGLTAAERAVLVERFGRTFDVGHAIYRDGDAADVCYILVEGSVRIEKLVRASAREVVRVAPGEVFGLEALEAGAERLASAIAAAQTVALAVDASTFRALLHGSAHVATRVVEQLVERVHGLEVELENALLPDPPSRVVHTLLRLARRAPGATKGVTLALTPVELARWTGLTVDECRRNVDRLAASGYVTTGAATIEIADLDGLRQFLAVLGAKEEIRHG